MNADSNNAQSSEDRFRLLYETTFNSVSNYISRRVFDDTLRSEIISEVYVTAWKNIDKIPLSPEDKLWLFGVARNTVLVKFRSESRKVRLLDKLRSNTPYDTFQDNSSYNGKATQMDPEVKIVRTFLDSLKEKDRELVRLIMWDDLNYSEASQLLGCTLNAARIRMHRIKRRLAKQLTAFDELNKDNQHLKEK